MGAGIPGIENVGGELDLVTRQTLHVHGVSVALAGRRRLRRARDGGAGS